MKYNNLIEFVKLKEPALRKIDSFTKHVVAAVLDSEQSTLITDANVDADHEWYNVKPSKYIFEVESDTGFKPCVEIIFNNHAGKACLLIMIDIDSIHNDDCIEFIAKIFCRDMPGASAIEHEGLLRILYKALPIDEHLQAENVALTIAEAVRKVHDFFG